MAVLSTEELNNLNPEKIYQIPCVLNNNTWSNIREDFNTILQNPRKLQFDENIRLSLSESKGIYMFFVEPEFPFLPKAKYLMYVGRVIGNNNFKKRFYDYVNCIGKKNERRNIQLLTNLWPTKTWVYIYELTLPDDEITAIEDNLIDNIVPPMNNKFKAKSAQQSRSIYH